MSIDIYKIPRAQVDVEAIAQEVARYLRIAGEDAEFLSYDPTRRDAICAQLYAHPDVKPSIWPSDTVGDGLPPEKYDEYLAQANAAIAQLTPPRALEDRVTRFHVAAAALIVFQQYKVAYALTDHHDLAVQVLQRSCSLMDEWQQNEYPRLFPDRARAAQGRTAHTRTPPAIRPIPSPRTPRTGTPPSTRHSDRPRAIPAEEAAGYLKNPHTMLDKRFQHSPPRGAEQEDYRGAWEMDSYCVRKRGGCVDHEFRILFEACGAGASLPMGREEVELLLKHSTVIV